MDIQNHIKEYNKNGYVLLHKVFSESFCEEMTNKLSKMEPKVFIPFSNVPWGYGQLIEVEPFDLVLKNEKIQTYCQKLLGSSDYKINHMMINNKSGFVGPDEIWHQEVFNMSTYAPGASLLDWKKFIQVFVAVDDHNLENGCLRFLPGSHKLGKVDCEDVVWNGHGHKRRVTYDAMKDAYENCGIKNCFMNKGDVLFFNHLLIHGSSSNPSPKNRRALVIQAQRNDVPKKDEDVFNKETAYRRNFVISEYEKKIKALKSSNMYNDFSKAKGEKNK